MSSFLFSCEKQEISVPTTNQTVTLNNQDDSSSHLKSKIVIFTCDLARKSHDCIDGFGICNFEWFPDAPWKQKMSGTINAETNQMTIFDESFINNGENILYIDEDIKLPNNLASEFGYSEIVVKAGQYHKNYNNDQSITLSVNLK